jgi:hypothetical protein
MLLVSDRCLDRQSDFVQMPGKKQPRASALFVCDAEEPDSPEKPAGFPSES